MEKILMIVNPKAGKAKSKKYIENILINFKKCGYSVELEVTTPERNAIKIIEEHKLNNEIIVLWGGDGTLNETLVGLSKSNQNAKIAFIPKGTTNDFGRSLKVSFDELEVSKHLSTYIEKEIDMGLIDDMPFNYVVGMGLFSKSSYKTSRKWKNRIGKAAYYINGVKELLHYKTHKIKFTLDSSEIIEGKFLYGSISNSKYMGGFPVFRKKDIKLDDGKFELLLAKKPTNIIATIILVIKILFGNLNDKHIIFKTTSTLKVEAQNGIDLSIDGEYGGKRKEFKISTVSKKTTFLVPKNKLLGM